MWLARPKIPRLINARSAGLVSVLQGMPKEVSPLETIRINIAIGDAAKMRNREDYEFWLIIPDKALSLAAFALLRDKEDNRWLTTPPHGLPRLVFDLLLDRYAGNSEATDELRDFCLAESISYEWASWP